MDMVKSICITEDHWAAILAQLRKEHPLSWTASRDCMKRNLQFTPRNCTEWGRHKIISKVYIDFYSEAAAVLFTLKYMHLGEHCA